MSQADLICLECPVRPCDEQSLWCLYRFITDPNEAQQRFVNKTIRRRKSKVNRREYFAQRYIEKKAREMNS